jgi:YD repeat-containing protein
MPTGMPIDIKQPNLEKMTLFTKPQTLKFVLMASWVLLCYCGMAQQKDQPVNFPSPNAASFSVFGDIPVNQFTGIPDINIPLVTASEGDLQLPISLNYHPASVQVNSHPGWTGLGWSLLAGGAITRSQRGFCDEQKTSQGTGIGFYYNYSRLNVSDWNTVNKMKDLAEIMTFGDPYWPVDPLADEFNFNFLGYSGKFIMGVDGQWKVTGKDQIKIVIDPADGIVNFNQIPADIRNHLPGQAMDFFYYYFNKFKLITPDGTTYEFGGLNATEYSVPYRAQASSYAIPTSWFLTKITSPTGRVVTFTYERGNMMCALAHQYGYSRYNRPGGGWFSLNPSCSGTSVNLARQPANGHLILPVYLKTITTSYATYEFLRSESTELKYFNFDLGDDPTNQYDGFLYFNDPLTELKWFKLDKINVRDDQNNIFKSFDFQYSNSTDTRLKLLSVTESDEDGVRNGRHVFTYNGEKLPPYCADRIDHWGYYNGYDVTSFVANTIEEWINLYPTARAPDQNGKYIRAELLDRVTYPTGGYTLYEYEPHRYRKVVNTDRTTLTTYAQDQGGGGARIKKVSSYLKDGTLAGTKEYYYVKNYTINADVSQLPSSGILGGLSQYYWPGYVGRDLDNNSFTYDLFTSNSLLPTYINAQGSHIGYSEVIERLSGNGYTRTVFSNFEPDVYGVSHMDESPFNYIDATRSVYSPTTSKSLERGYPQLAEVFDEAGNKVRSSSIWYQASSADYVPGLDLEHFDVCSNVTASAQVWFGTSFKKYIYAYQKVREDITVYDSDLSGSATASMQYHYNGNKLVDQITETASDGKDAKKELRYASQVANGATPTDPEALAVARMAGSAYMINVPVEITEYRNGKVTTSTVRKFTTVSNIVVPARDYRTELQDPVTDYTKITTSGSGTATTLVVDGRCKQTSTYTYDAYGNLQEATGEDGITIAYVWGYKHLFPIAQITNATYQQVLGVLGQTAIDGLNNTPGTDAQVRQALQILRTTTTLAGASVVTYTYAPLKGITSKTDPGNKTEFYEYDSQGRLAAVKDTNGHITKAYSYQYHQ